MPRRGLTALTCAALLAGCAGVDTASHGDYRATVARALNHLQAKRPPTHYSISEPWAALTGSMMVCTRRDVPDGRGGTAPTTDYSMFVIEAGRITAVLQDQTLAGCPNRAYSPLTPV